MFVHQRLGAAVQGTGFEAQRVHHCGQLQRGKPPQIAEEMDALIALPRQDPQRAGKIALQSVPDSPGKNADLHRHLPRPVPTDVDTYLLES